MKLAFIASFIIGGLLWLSIFQINNSVFTHSGRQTLYQSVKVKNEAFAQLMERDLRRVGFGVPADIAGNGIMKASRNSIEFVSTFDGPGSTSAILVSWTFSPGTTTENSAESEADAEITLVRSTENRTTEIDADGDSSIVYKDKESMAYELGALDFRFRFFDQNMAEINVDVGEELSETTRSEIRHIGFQLLSESNQSYGDRPERHAIERTVTPRNLNLGF